LLVASVVAYAGYRVLEFVIVLWGLPRNTEATLLAVTMTVAVAFCGGLWAALRTNPGWTLMLVGSFAGVAGLAGFVFGFLGPLMLTPGANQGPMLGIFVTGPIGAVCGAVAGLVYAVCSNEPPAGSGEHPGGDA
jgi:hypothetical protein